MHSHDHCSHKKAISINYYEYVSVVLVIRSEKYMHHIILSFMACLAVPYFYIISWTEQFFEKNSLNIKCVFWVSLQILSETFFVLRKIQKLPPMYTGLQAKNPLFLSDCNKTSILTDFQKIFKFQISWKSIQWESSCSKWMDRHDKGNSCFSRFCKHGQKWMFRSSDENTGRFIKKIHHNWTTCLFGPYSLLSTHQWVHAFSLFHQMMEKDPVSKMVCCVGNIWKQTKFTNVAKHHIRQFPYHSFCSKCSKVCDPSRRWLSEQNFTKQVGTTDKG